ncbi:MAG TPA: selenide, water dikinase SelD [Bacteroidales bacterium]|nr:selenide, water dikinase SelD [Bacteroidales bacterium]HPT10259.1 selenide, water dikinase SelD [Bacteroidales bacterium]
MKPVYLDYNATTPLDPLVLAAMQPYLADHFGNPSSAHSYGITAKLAVEKGRKQLASLLNARPDEIIFTAGGTESNNYAIRGAALANRSKGNNIITSSIEHPAVTEVCRYLETIGFTVTWLPVDAAGMVNPEDVLNAITPATILITVMHANNETGTIQPISEIGTIAKEHGILFHSDAAQSIGKIPVRVEELRADLLSVAGHKLYAPKGIGALYIRRGVSIGKLIFGADHEAGRRPGTENVTGIAGLGEAADIIMKYEAGIDMEGKGLFGPGLAALRDRLHEGIRLEIPEVRLNGHPSHRLPNTLNLGFPGVEANVLLNRMKGVAASAGAACHADATEVSGVLASMHVPMKYAMGSVRFSLGRMTTCEEIDRALPVIVEAYRTMVANRRPVAFREDLFHSSVESQPAFETAPVPARAEVLNPEKTETTTPKVEIPVIRLTEYTHSPGCACKIRPQLLEKILHHIPPAFDPAVMVDHTSSDDAAVYRIDHETAIVQTVDFIPPVVDDPYLYGAIAAANALSDVYAMGGKPLFALSIMAFPERLLPVETLHAILKGANDKVAEAGISILGGHSVDDAEPKFGLVVTGRVHPDKVLRNNTVKKDDLLVLTKPLGSGILTTAIQRGVARVEDIREVADVMMELNRRAAEIMAGFPVSACTDVTGFGLAGHLLEMIRGREYGAELFSGQVPVMKGVWDFIAAGTVPGGSLNNRHHAERSIDWSPEISEGMKCILTDAQTSGGLLIALPEKEGRSLVEALQLSGLTEASVIGRIIGEGGRIRVIA